MVYMLKLKAALDSLVNDIGDELSAPVGEYGENIKNLSDLDISAWRTEWKLTS